MGSFKPDAFDPRELELIESAYDVAWKTIVARDLNRDTSRDAERQASLRRLIFVFARQGPVDLDTLCDKVLGGMPETWMPLTAAKRGRKTEGGISQV
jgi:hypothetical protein